MVKIYGLDISVLPDPAEDNALFRRLSKKRQERVISCSTEKGRKEMAGAGLLLSYVLERYGYTEDDIIYGWNGKPTLTGSVESVNIVETAENKDPIKFLESAGNVECISGSVPCFNLSHSGDMVILAVSSYPVGCDIECTGVKKEKLSKETKDEKNVEIKKDKECCNRTEKKTQSEEKISERNSKIARRFFTEREQKTAEEGGTKAFYRIWTRKESYIKMTGEGMKVPFLSLETCPIQPEEEENDSDWLDYKKIAREGELVDCEIQEYTLPGYQISVCAREKEFAKEILVLMNPSCQIDERRICKAGYDIDGVAGNANMKDSFQGIKS